jgi:hypothetical protein
MPVMPDPTSLKVISSSQAVIAAHVGQYVVYVVVSVLLYLYTMSAEVFVNKYKAPETSILKGIHGDTPIEKYDFNYCFDIKTLRSDRVELRPFLVRHYIT